MVNKSRKNLEWCVRDWEEEIANVRRQQQIMMLKPTVQQAQLVKWAARLVDPAERSIWRAAQVLEVAKRAHYWDRAGPPILRSKSGGRDERSGSKGDKKSEGSKNVRNNPAEEELGRFMLTLGLLIALAAIIGITFAVLTFFGGARPQEEQIQQPPYIVHASCHLSVNYIAAL